MRWVWIDRFEEFHSGASARTVKAVSMAEDHVHEQFPECPVFPQGLIVEGLAQTGGILVGEANDFREKVVLAKIPSIKFVGHAVPGDVLEYHAQMLDLRAEGATVAVTATCNGAPLAEGEIMYAHIDQARTDAAGAKNSVFTKDHLINLLKLAKGTYSEAGK